MGTITAGSFRVSSRISIQKSDGTNVAHLGQDPGASGIWGFIAERGYGLMCRYSGNNYFRIFCDASTGNGMINMASTDRIIISDNLNNPIAYWYGRTAGFTNVGGLDMYGVIRLYTTNSPPTSASNGMMFYHTTWNEVWVFRAGSWKALQFVP
jgi:hypothetical protein